MPPEELEKHLILNSNRLRTVEDARLEIVNYSKPSDTGSRGHSDPMDVNAINSVASGKEKCHRVHEMVVSSVGELTFNATAMFTQTNAEAMENRASHGP